MVKKKVIIILLSLFIFSVPAVFGVDYSIEKYDIDAEILEKGDMQVTEKIVYEFSDDLNGLYRELLYSYMYNGQKDDLSPASKRYQASDVYGLSVWYSDTSFNDMKIAIKKDERSLSKGMNGYYSVERINQGEKKDIIKVYTPVKDGDKKYVKYVYTVKDVVVNYNDFAEIYWNFIGGDWKCSIRNITIKLSLPVETNIKAFYHTFGIIKDFKNDGKQIILTIPRLSSKVAADIRAIFPNNVLRYSNISKKINEEYDFNELEKVENSLKNNIENYEKFKLIFGMEIFIIPIVFVLTLIFTGRSKDGRIKKASKAEVYTSILDTYSLDEYLKIYNPYDSLLNGNLMIATIMDMANKKYIKMDARKKIVKSKDYYEYYVSLNKNARYDLLTEYEKIVINYIFLKKDSININVEDIKEEEFELNERFKELSNKTSLAEKVRKKIQKIENNYKEKHYDKPKIDKYRPSIVISIIVFLSLVMPTIIICPTGMRALYIFSAIIISLIFIAVTSIKVSISGISIKEKYVEEFNRLKGLYKYLNEYSLLKEKYPIEVNLWDKYMIFACLFGIAKKVSKEFKEELIARGMSEDDIYSYYPYMYIGNYFYNYTSSISSATYSGSASSSSGGFSGGGGGGRRRRRWRRFLKK